MGRRPRDVRPPSQAVPRPSPPSTSVGEVLGEGTVSGLRLRDTLTGQESELDVTGMYLAIGHDPRSGTDTHQSKVTDAAGAASPTAPWQSPSTA